MFRKKLFFIILLLKLNSIRLFLKFLPKSKKMWKIKCMQLKYSPVFSRMKEKLLELERKTKTLILSDNPNLTFFLRNRLFLNFKFSIAFNLRRLYSHIDLDLFR